MRLINRKIKVVFTKTINNNQKILTLTSDELFITASVQKHLSHMKDESIVTIYNLSDEYFQLIKQYDTMTIYAGRLTGKNEWIDYLIATQTVLIATIDKSDVTTPKAIIIGSSRFRNKEIKSLRLKQGLSLKNALSLLCKRGGIKALIDPKLTNKVLKSEINVTHISTALAQIMRDYSFIQVSNDSNGEDYDIRFSLISNTQNRLSIDITPESHTLIEEWVSIDNQANISFTSLPNRVPFKIGDSIRVNNRYLNQYVGSSSDYNSYNATNKRLERSERTINSDGSITNEYIIMSLAYDLDVTGTFNVKIVARPRSLFDQTRVIRGGI